MNSSLSALQRLKEGNLRFASDQQTQNQSGGAARRKALIERQDPFAIILGCSDSRVPAEIIFDQGLGDLFVIRVAGNIVAPSQIGSVEFAVSQFGIPLVLVMGHADCGAIHATLDALNKDKSDISPNIAAIVDRIRPSVEPLLAAAGDLNQEGLMDEAVRANVAASVLELMHGSEILEKMINEGQLSVVGAEYSLENGLVEFL